MFKFNNNPIIFSAQSSVLYGYVGNNTANFVYQHHKIEAITVNTVTLAAHPGYGNFFAQKLPDCELENILNDFLKLKLESNIFAIQTGYLGNSSQVKKLQNFIKKILINNNKTVYFLDPVFGDNNKIYVNEEIIREIKKYLLPLANFIKPNKFELEYLTKTKIKTYKEAIEASHKLLNDQCEYVFVSGVQQFKSEIADIIISKNDYKLFKYKKLKSGVSGSGDFLGALFLVYLSKGFSPFNSAKNASKITHQILQFAKDNRYMPLHNLIKKS